MAQDALLPRIQFHQLYQKLIITFLIQRIYRHNLVLENETSRTRALVVDGNYKVL